MAPACIRAAHPHRHGTLMSVAWFKVKTTLVFLFPRLFLPQSGSAAPFTVQLHKQPRWCPCRAVTRYGTSGQGQRWLKPASLPKEVITK